MPLAENRAFKGCGYYRISCTEASNRDFADDI